MLLTLHPKIKKSDLLRSGTIKNYKNEIKKLTGLVQKLEGINPFKEGKFAKLISTIHHQEFFKRNFSLKSIDEDLNSLTDEEKLFLLDRVIDRFLEVDLEKQKQFISNT